jgi:hypothetical protein
VYDDLQISIENIQKSVADYYKIKVADVQQRKSKACWLYLCSELGVRFRKKNRVQHLFLSWENFVSDICRTLVRQGSGGCAPKNGHNF